MTTTAITYQSRPIVATFAGLGWELGTGQNGQEQLFRYDGEILEVIQSVDESDLHWAGEVVIGTGIGLDHDGLGWDDYGVTLAEVAAVLAAPNEYALLFLRLGNLPGRAE